MPGIKKLYYSIGEVAEILGENTSVLRFWEKEFEELNPRRRSGRRTYAADDLAVAKRIWHLLKVEKYTLEGAKQVLRKGDERRNSGSMHQDLIKLRAFLKNIERQLSVDAVTGRSAAR